MSESKTNGIIKAEESKCVRCDAPAVAFFPAFDPDIPSYPYCRRCLDDIKLKLMIEIYK